jgi:hypothetical protein
MDRSIAALRDEAADLLRRYTRAEKDADRTPLLRRVAEVFVDLRGHFYDDDGVQDWRGRTYPYRQVIGDAYGLANVPKDELSTVQAAVRYHVSNVLRERLSADDLEALGLRPSSARERSVEKRERQSALLSAFRNGPAPSEGLDVLRALAAAHALLSRIPAGSLRDLTDQDRRKAARTFLADLSADVDRLSKDSRRRR